MPVLDQARDDGSGIQKSKASIRLRVNMSPPVSRSKSSKISWLLPGFHILGAVLVVVSTGLFSAVHSPLGQWISAGESPGFAWIGVNINSVMGFVLVYLVFVCWLQITRTRPSHPSSNLLTFLICAEVVGIALVALLLFLQQTAFLPLVLSVLLAALLLRSIPELFNQYRAFSGFIVCYWSRHFGSRSLLAPAVGSGFSGFGLGVHIKIPLSPPVVRSRHCLVWHRYDGYYTWPSTVAVWD